MIDLNNKCEWTRAEDWDFNISCAEKTGKRADSEFKKTKECQGAWDFVFCPYCGKEIVLKGIEPVLEAKKSLNSFNKHGFATPNFEGEILKEFDKTFIGCIKDKGNRFSTIWNSEGVCRYTLAPIGEYNLSPLKKNWYEDESSIGKLLIFEPTNKGIVTLLKIYDNAIEVGCKGLWSHFTQDFENYRPATKEELLSLVVED